MFLQEGQYLNHRQEVVTVVKNPDGWFEQEGTEGSIVYKGTTCFFWNPHQERYFMATDPKEDLVLHIGPKILH